MFERVVIAAEFGRGQEEIVRCLKSLKPFGVRECLLVQQSTPLNAHPRVSPLDLEQPAMDMMPFSPDLQDERLDREVERLQTLGLQVQGRTVHLDLSHELDRIAREEGYQLILVAEQTHSLLGQMLFGGVAHGVIHRASCPVLQVRIPDGEEPTGNDLSEPDLADHILFPTDFSANAVLAFQQVRDMVRLGARRVTLVHVQDRDRIEPHLTARLEAFNEKDRLRLEALRHELLDAGEAAVEIRLLYGSPTAELLRLIDSEPVSLVVMGSQGRGYIREIYLGSVSHNIARHARASVLLVPAERDEQDG